MKKGTLRVFIMTLLVTILTGCRQSVPQSGTVLEEGNAVYYWIWTPRNGLFSTPIISAVSTAAISTW